jgi:hypothetical protein
MSIWVYIWLVSKCASLAERPKHAVVLEKSKFILFPDNNNLVTYKIINMWPKGRSETYVWNESAFKCCQALREHKNNKAYNCMFLV